MSVTRRRFLLDAVAATGCLVAAGLWVAGTPRASDPVRATPTACPPPDPVPVAGKPVAPTATPSPEMTKGEALAPSFEPQPAGRVAAPQFTPAALDGDVVGPSFPEGGR